MQRLAIARVLLPDPDILMLDEPHTGLDQEAVALLNQIIKKKRDSATSILIISHDFEQVHALADRAAVLKKGKIVSTKLLGEEVSLAEMKTWYESEVKSS